MARKTGRFTAREVGPRTLLLPFTPKRAEFVISKNDRHFTQGYVHNTSLSQIAESTEYIDGTAQTLYDSSKCIVHYETVNNVKKKVISGRCTRMADKSITIYFDLFDPSYLINMRVSNE